MKAAILSSSQYPEHLRRIQSMGCYVDSSPLAKAVPLAPRSLDLVYLVPFADVTSNDWAEARVRLARANRYYIIFGENLSSREIMQAARDGAHDVVTDADADERWLEALESAASSQALWWQLYGGRGEVNEGNLIGHSSAMKSLRESVQRIGPTDASVLILGESGTGKERVAEAIHAASGKGNFVALNCAAIPGELLESELFGAEKGAYTGANQVRRGLAEEATGGTLFLDEIGEMSLSMQPKLLRFLETRRARRIGSTKEYECDVRLIAATNRDLQTEAEAGRFRPDLFYRLGEVLLTPPPLRERAEDIPDLARAFLEDAAERMGKNFESLEPELIYKFQQFEWPGNVRELKQNIERLAIHYDGPIMRSAWWDAPRRARREEPAASPSAPQQRYATPNKKQRYQMARELLAESGDDLTWTAAQLGIHPTTLYRWRKNGKV